MFSGKDKPLEGVCAIAFPVSEDGPQEVVEARSEEGGLYELTGLQAGEYKVEYSSCEDVNVVAAYYDEASAPDHRAATYEEGMTLNVKAETITETLPVLLEAGGVIEGTITESEGHAVTALMCVEAISPTGGYYEGFTYTKTGHYVIEGLATGSYDLYIGECAEGKATTWAGQFYNGASSLAGATALSVTAGHEPPVPVTANFKLVRASAVKPVSTAAPGITGTAAVGQTLSCSSGSWSGTPAPTYTYQWSREGVAIAGATSSTYVVQQADEGHGLTCTVTATNEAGSASETSAPIAIPAKPVVKPGTAAAGGNASVKSGVVQLSLTCTGEGACKGTAKLVAKVTVEVRKHGKVKHKSSSVTIGEASFSIAANGKETLDVHLTGKGKSLLAKAGKHGLTVALSGTGVKPGNVVLKAASNGKAGKKHKG